MKRVDQSTSKTNSLFNKKLVKYHPEEVEKFKKILIRQIDVVARSFCEPKNTMLNAVNTGKAKIGSVVNHDGVFCIFIEYQGIQVLKPIHVIH